MDATIRKLGSDSADEREVEDKFVVIETIATTNVLSIIITLPLKDISNVRKLLISIDKCLIVWKFLIFMSIV